MKILVLSDREEKALWDHYDASRLAGVDLILSCGDLDADYLEFLVTMTKAPLLYVRGNHDGKYDTSPPCGCIPVDDMVYDFQGLRILGLGGSMRYKPGGDMYTEAEMRSRVRRVLPQVMLRGGFDILLTHAPAKGYGDMEDLPHRGFACFNELLEKYRPAYMLHGHVHQEYGGFVRERQHPCGTRIFNACGYLFLTVGAEEYPARGQTGSFLYDFVTGWQDNRARKKQRDRGY